MAQEMNLEALKANLARLDKQAELANDQAKKAGTYDPQTEKLSALLGDVDFCEKLLLSDDTAEAKALLAENGIEMSEEAVDTLGKYVASISKNLIENGGEISEDELKNVTGGVLTEAAVSVASTSLFSSVSSGAGVGAAAGTAGFPVVGTIIGVTIGVAVGVGIYFRDEIASGAKKLGRWIKSWF